ncbi:MAG TPA: peptidylprolyl isomerase, partial [Bacteroidetes bacterium]|nr:peptidylprolyl isomerase [Bacteroidota bacterium]
MNHKVITLEYDLYKDTSDGEMIESTKGKNPLVFLSGSGQMIPDFESNVSDLEVGEYFSFSIATENAYGKRKEEAI